jgi:hypothetical protein
MPAVVQLGLQQGDRNCKQQLPLLELCIPKAVPSH